MEGDAVTKEDAATGFVRAAKTSPWVGVVVTAFLLGEFVTKQGGRINALEVHALASDTVATALARSQRSLVADMDTLKRRQEVTMCAMNPTVLQACRLYTLRSRLP